MPYLGVLGSNFENPLSYLKSAPSNLPYYEVWCKKQKSLNMGPKMSDFGILVLEVENNIVIFEITTFKFVCL